ncbi:hypothetical protein IAG44_13575 [Streptomyces roseirectus]|uniref:Lipoprotein n=1 Tax=Streptomyces roseirectus TaxID=2768066 RepID=A0A7H0IC61_9ACTN|nr:hypothetical protein [Streptomyces roseirectus]QNP70377.1 hypothetical protein IAG44_13575 [Streptomyces roseirectus]
MTVSAPARTRTALLGAVCALALGVSGCGEDPDAGTNGVGKLGADKIHERARTAASSAGAVRLSGTVLTSGRTYRLDMRLKEDGGTGTVSSQGTTFQLLRVGEELYLKADAEFWKQDGDATAAAGKLDGKYVKIPSGDPSYTKFSGFTDKDLLLDALLALHGSLSKDGHHEQAGTRTIRITGDKGAGGTLDVSLKGEPYPLLLQRAGSAGSLAFSSWGQDFTLTEPPKDETVDYGKQLPAS